MRHIRTRIRDKRGVDYTEQEIRELANVKLERILDPDGIRSDLLEHFRQRPKTKPLAGAEQFTSDVGPGNYAFEDHMLFASSRGLIAFLRRLLRPVLKLLFNPNVLISVLHKQSALNAHPEQQIDKLAEQFTSRDEVDTLNFEVLNNLVVEITRLGIEVKNLKMQVQSVNSRLDFDERRARALEGLVKPTADTAPPTPAASPDAGDSSEPAPGGPRKRRRRRRGGRRRTGADGDAARSADQTATTSQPDTGATPTQDVVDAAPPDAGNADPDNAAADRPPPTVTATTDTADRAPAEAIETPTSEPTAPEPTTPRAPDDGAADSSEQ